MACDLFSCAWLHWILDIQEITPDMRGYVIADDLSAVSLIYQADPRRFEQWKQLNKHQQQQHSNGASTPGKDVAEAAAVRQDTFRTATVRRGDIRPQGKHAQWFCSLEMVMFKSSQVIGCCPSGPNLMMGPADAAFVTSAPKSAPKQHGTPPACSQRATQTAPITSV
jgi:hypothetical protein